MKKHLNWDRVVAVASWIIVLVLFYGFFYIMTHALNPASPFVKVMGVSGTRIFFSVVYGTQAGLLGYAKLFHKDRLRRHALLFIYLTGFFLAILGLILNGFTIRLVSNLVLASLAAICWLYWKFQNDYLSSEVVKGHVTK